MEQKVGVDDEGKRIRSVAFVDGKVQLIDQPALPTEFRLVNAHSVAEVAEHIKKMTVRGAPAIGAAGGYAMVLAARESQATTTEELLKDLKKAKDFLDASRPTAVNLMWATERMLKYGETLASASDMTLDQMKHGLLEQSEFLAELDVDINRRMSEAGATVVKDGANILHHCNTGSLATVDIGTALGVITTCHKMGKGIHVWVDETRPRLQGARLSAWELMRDGVPMHLIADNAAGHLMRTGKVDIVLFGADRVAENGDVANKIGTYKLAVVARENGIPVYAVVPTSTIDLAISTGDEIPIEERNAEEVTHVKDAQIAPDGCPVFNPAFDVTPAKYLTGIITDEGICYPPFEISLRKAKEAAEKRIAAALETAKGSK